MHQLDLDLQSAMDYIGVLHDRLAGAFLLTKDRLPSFGPHIDAQVARYVHGLGNWVRANDQWSFESQRYFGTKGLEIIQHRTVQLLPKTTASGIPATIPAGPPALPKPTFAPISAPTPNVVSYAPNSPSTLPACMSSSSRAEFAPRARSLSISLFDKRTVQSLMPIAFTVLCVLYATIYSLSVYSRTLPMSTSRFML